MPIIQVDMTRDEWLAAPPNERTTTDSGRLMLVAVPTSPPVESPADTSTELE